MNKFSVNNPTDAARLRFLAKTLAWVNGVPPDNFGTEGEAVLNIGTGEVYQKVGGTWVVAFLLGGPLAIVETPSVPLVITPAEDGQNPGDRIEYYITPDAPGVTLDFHASVVKPTSSGLIFPMALTQDTTTVVMLKWLGDRWALTSLGGEYPPATP